MYYSLGKYPIQEVWESALQLQEPFLTEIGRAYQSTPPERRKQFLVTLCVSDLILPFKHLTLDKAYHIFCYVTHEYHGTIGNVAAIKHGEPHAADIRGGFLPIITLPPSATNPLEVVYCDGTPEGYFEAILFEKLLHGLPRHFNIYCDNNTILFHRPKALNSDWDLLLNIEDWTPKVKNSSVYLYMYEYEHGIEASNGQSRISLQQYTFTDQTLFLHAVQKKSPYPVTRLQERGRYEQGRHCCVFCLTSINIAEQAPFFPAQDGAGGFR